MNKTKIVLFDIKIKKNIKNKIFLLLNDITIEN